MVRLSKPSSDTNHEPTQARKKMSKENSNTPEVAGAENPANEQLRQNDGFQDMVVRAAEEMVLHADLNSLVVFAYGSWEAAREAWGKRQRARFRQPRPGRRKAA